MVDSVVPLRFIYRSESMVPLLTVAQETGIWARHGLKVEHFEFSTEPLDAEEQLFAGKIDFIFGNHVTPYMQIGRGNPMVCLAQSENWDQHWIATAPEYTQLSQLNGKRIIAKKLIDENDGFCGHSDGTRLLILELNGVDTKKLDYVKPSTVSDPIKAVAEGQAAACFISPGRGEKARAAGLFVHELPPLPMVHNITLTTSPARLAQDPPFAEAVIKVVADATHFIKTRRADTMELLKNPVDKMREGQLERFAASYEEQVDEYEAGLFPRAEAIVNIHKLACMVYPEAKAVNPLELWDLAPLRDLHNSGYFEELYGGKPPITRGF